ncbi:MAG: DNA modification methylase [Leucobacter sp.]
MKNRIAASIALAAGLALGASGCSLIATNGTEVQYAPSDGIEITANGVALRNVLLVVDDSGENLNLVFTGVNSTESPARVSVNLSADAGDALVEFELPVGTTSFGDLEQDQDVLVATIPDVAAGTTIESYFTINGEGDMHEFVPVLDGTLAEYQPYVLDPQVFAEAEESATEGSASEDSAAEGAASEDPATEEAATEEGAE